MGLVGEPGVGKSRLLYEFRQSLEGERVRWLEGHCVAYGQTTPYLPILGMLRANFQIEEDDNPLQIHEKLRQGIRRVDPALEGTLPFLGEVFGLPGSTEALKHLDPKDKRQKTFEAIRTALADGFFRPAVPYWPEVSDAMNEAVRLVIQRGQPAKPVLDRLHLRIADAARRKGAAYPPRQGV